MTESREEFTDRIVDRLTSVIVTIQDYLDRD
jgi:hypothetical protein